MDERTEAQVQADVGRGMAKLRKLRGGPGYEQAYAEVMADIQVWERIAPRDSMEYRAVIICSSDPCPYCRAPATERVEAATFPSEKEARVYGLEAARLIYGASVHRIEIEARRVKPWRRMQATR